MSNAFPWSTKIRWSSWCSRLFSRSWRRANIIAVVYRPGVELHCISRMKGAMKGHTLFRITRAYSFPAIASKVIPLLFSAGATAFLFGELDDYAILEALSFSAFFPNDEQKFVEFCCECLASSHQDSILRKCRPGLAPCLAWVILKLC